MNMRHAKLKTKPRTLWSLTGFNAIEFDALLESFGVSWDDFITEQAERPIRKRAYGAGRTAHLKAIVEQDEQQLVLLSSISNPGSTRLLSW